MRARTRRISALAALASGSLLILAGIAGANVPLTRVSADPYQNQSSQHATEVEPDTFAHGSTVVATFQVGRFFNGGASDSGVVRSGDGGARWDAPGFLHLTFNSGGSGPYERVSDPSVAYDAAHSTWLISSLPLLPGASSPTGLVNRSTDDGPDVGSSDQHPAARLELRRPRQELDGLRQPSGKPILRTLLHAVRQLRRR